MAHNLILGDPSESSWCVYGQIGTIGDIPKNILAFYETEESAEEAAKSLRAKFEEHVSTRVFKYEHAKDELDLMKLLCLDVIGMAVQYFAERRD